MNRKKDLTDQLVHGGNVMGFSDTQPYTSKTDFAVRAPQKKRSGWDRTIFCIVENTDLLSAIKNCAKELDCEALFDWPHSPELIFDHHFVAVVEVDAVDKSAWDLYVEACNDGNINVPCLLVGDTRYLDMPDTQNIISFGVCSPESIHHVVITIKAIQKNIINISLI